MTHRSTAHPKLILCAIAALMVAACDDTAEEAGPGGVSVGEAEALDEAAEIIEQRRLPVEVLPDTSDGGAPLPPEKPPEANGEAQGGEAAE